MQNACKKSGYAKNEYFILAATGTKDIAYSGMNPQIESMKKLTDTFTFTSDYSKGNIYYQLCDGGSHWWTECIVHYNYDALPYFFHGQSRRTYVFLKNVFAQVDTPNEWEIEINDRIFDLLSSLFDA